MRLLKLLSTYKISISVVVIVLVGSGFAFEPITRDYVATDAVCDYCHSWSGIAEYSTEVNHSYSKPHGLDQTEGSSQARCVDCHMPEGFGGALYGYTHAISITDLFGNFRDRDAERSGDWIPPGAARAYRVRDELLKNDSNTCRNCHVESEIVPKRERGKTAHEDALENHETCISCHNNLVHRFVAMRMTDSKGSDSDESEEDELDDDLDSDLDDDLDDDLSDELDDDELEDL